MIQIPRRGFLQGAAASSLFMHASVARAVEGRSKLTDIDHLIVLMKENRSFDHYFGTLSGVRGFDDPAAAKPDGSSLFRQADSRGRDGYVLPFHLDTRTTNAQRLHELSHAWGAQHAAWNGGGMDSWIPAHRKSDGGRGPFTMGYLSR